MNRDRLGLMATLLEEIEAGTWEPTGALINLQPFPWRCPGHRFDLAQWCDTVLPDCGFSACAIGHACLDDRFNQQGLFLNWRTSAPQFAPGGTVLPSPLGWLSVTAFFELGTSDAYHLFDRDHYPDAARADPAAVRERVEALLNQAT